MDSDYFKPCGEHTIVFNGTEDVQTIKVNSSSSFFNKVVFSGSDKVFGTTCEINSFEKDPKCNVTFYGDGKSGWKLEGNETIEGDLYLVNGELDLGEYDLTITGNLIQGGGTIKLGTGTLTVNGDYRIQSRTEKENVAEGETEKYNYGNSTGSLEMTSAECSLIVKGNFITQSTVSHNGKLTAGTMEIGGNFTELYSNRSDNFVSTGTHIVKFTGKNAEHEINLYSSSSYFNILDITNTTIDLKSDNVYVRKELKSESGKIIEKTIYLQNAKLPKIINGNACIFAYTLGNDLIINGDLKFTSESDYSYRDINLNGNSLTVNGNLTTYRNNIYFNNGKIICNGNCAITIHNLSP